MKRGSIGIVTFRILLLKAFEPTAAFGTLDEVVISDERRRYGGRVMILT